MAHKSCAMPLLKLTKRPTREKKEVEYLHRGVQGPDRSTSSIICDQVVQFSQSNDLSLQSTRVKFSCLMRICPFSRLLRESQHLMR